MTFRCDGATASLRQSERPRKGRAHARVGRAAALKPPRGEHSRLVRIMQACADLGRCARKSSAAIMSGSPRATLASMKAAAPVRTDGNTQRSHTCDRQADRPLPIRPTPGYHLRPRPRMLSVKDVARTWIASMKSVEHTTASRSPDARGHPMLTASTRTSVPTNAINNPKNTPCSRRKYPRRASNHFSLPPEK
jgi:hypothetical protein